jgi:hypothetical protein
MRFALSLFALILASPAIAAGSIPDQASEAYRLFAGGLSQKAYLTGDYGKALFKDIAGNWVRLAGPDDKSGAETYGAEYAALCGGPATITLASPNQYTLNLTTNLTNTSNFTQQYSQVAGSTYGEFTDPATYFKTLNLGPDKIGDQADQQRALLLSIANGLVDIYRPSPDILVILHERGYPLVLARCAAPAADTGSSASSAEPQAGVPASSLEPASSASSASSSAAQ